MENEKKPFQLDVVSVRLVKDAYFRSSSPINSPEDAVKIVGGQLCEMDREVVCIINLKADGRPINCTFASIGCIDQSATHPRELFKAAILSNAAKMIMLHNHPSGSLNPSSADVSLTDRMIQLCELIGIPLLDHIIVGGGDDSKYFSFKSKNMMHVEKLQFETDYRNIDFHKMVVRERGAEYMEKDIVKVQSAVRSNYEGYAVLAQFDRSGINPEQKIYLGKSENYDNHGNYDNSDNSLVFISDNPKMYHFLYGDGWVKSQQEMIENGAFTADDYAQYAQLKESTLKEFEHLQVKEVKFDIDMYIPDIGVPFQYPDWSRDGEERTLMEKLETRIDFCYKRANDYMSKGNGDLHFIWMQKFDEVRMAVELMQSQEYAKDMFAQRKTYCLELANENRKTENETMAAAWQGRYEEIKDFMEFLNREEERGYNIQHTRQRLFIDMDGTLTVFIPQESTLPLYEKGYFLNLPPHENVIEAVRHIIKGHPEIEVYILSAYLTDSSYAFSEKNAWVDKYLPEIDENHRIFIPNGSDKKEWIGGLRDNDFLIDDYTENLQKWLPFKGIKLINAINHTRGTWQYDRIRYNREPLDLANKIVGVMKGQVHVMDEKLRAYGWEETLLNAFAWERNKDKLLENILDFIQEQQKKEQGENMEQEEKRKDTIEIENGTISFYVAECMEFTSLGEYHEGLTLKEAFDIYEKIPSERLHAVKGIGFDLQDGSMYSGTFDLMHENIMQDEIINGIEHYRNSPLVQQAIADCKNELEQRYGQQKQPEQKPYIHHFYVAEDLQKRGQLDIHTFSDIKEALSFYASLPLDKVKTLGIENNNELPGSLDFIQCRNGVDILIEDYLHVSGWNNPEIRKTVQEIEEAVNQQFESLKKEEQEVAQENISQENEITHGEDDVLHENSEHIHVDGHDGTWYVIDKEEKHVLLDGSVSTYYLLEHESFGDEAANLIVNEHGALVLSNVYNGFDDFQERINEFAETLDMFENTGFEIVEVTDTLGCKVRDIDGNIHSFENFEALYDNEVTFADLIEKVSDRTVSAMEVAGYHLDAEVSTTMVPVYNYEGQTVPLRFNSLKENIEWLDGVVFDDPEISRQTEYIMHPDRYLQALSETEKKEIVFTYETIMHTPESERMTRWYSEQGIVVQKPFFKEEKTPISAVMIEEKCKEILQNHIKTDIDNSYKSLVALNRNNLTENVESLIEDLQKKASDDMKRQNSPWGSWFSRISNPEHPEDYISLDITGYSTRNSVIESITLVLGNNVQEQIVLDEISADKYMEKVFSEGKTLSDIGKEMVERFDPSNLTNFQHYNPHGLGEHTLDEHYSLLTKNGYTELPDYESFNTRILTNEVVERLNEETEKETSASTKENTHYAGGEYYRYFYDYNKADADAFKEETGWKMFFGSDYQGLNGGTYVVYREIPDLPEHLREYAKEQEEMELNNSADEIYRDIMWTVVNQSIAMYEDARSMEAASNMRDYPLTDGQAERLWEHERDRGHTWDVGENERTYDRDGMFLQEYNAHTDIKETILLGLQKGISETDVRFLLDNVWDGEILADTDEVRMLFEEAVDGVIKGDVMHYKGSLQDLYGVDLERTEDDYRGFHGYNLYLYGGELYLEASEQNGFSDISWLDGENRVRKEVVQGFDLDAKKIAEEIKAFAENPNRGEVIEISNEHDRRIADLISINTEYGFHALKTELDAREINKMDIAINERFRGYTNEELKEAIEFVENYVPVPNSYYYPELDLDGTAEELFIQARNGYIDSPEALAKVQEILSNPVENKSEEAFYVGVLKEIAETDGTEYQMFAQMKKDLLDEVQPEEMNLRDGLSLEVRREQDNILIALMENSTERDASGATVIPFDSFTSMTALEISTLVNEVYAYNMIEVEREPEPEREKITLHIKYTEPINFNGFHIENDTIIFDDMENLKAFANGETAYDTLDNAVRKKDNEILLYAENEHGDVVWGIKEREDLEKEHTNENQKKILIDGQECYQIDTWQNSGATYILGQHVEDTEFFYARGMENGEQYDFEFDSKPSRETVEDHFWNLVSQIALDRHEAEFGADGRRAFPNLNDEIKENEVEITKEEISDSKSSQESVVEQEMTYSENEAIVRLAERIDNFMYDNDYYEYADQVGIEIAERSEHRAKIANWIENNSQKDMDAMIKSISDNSEKMVSQDEGIGNFSEEIREANDLIYSLQHMEEYLTYYGRTGESNAKYPILEYRNDENRMLEGNQIPMQKSSTRGFSDRSIVYNAVRDFEQQNNIPEQQRVIHDGSYEDKEFLYNGYDRYVGMSHQNDLSIQPYMERVESLKANSHEFSSLSLIAEIYYAQQNGLSPEQISYLLDAVKEEKYPSWLLQDLRRGLELGLSNEQVSQLIGIEADVRDLFLGYLLHGASKEDINALKGCDVAGYYILSPHLRDGSINHEQTQAIVGAVNQMKEWNRDDYNSQYEKNPKEASPRFGYMDTEFLTEYLTNAAVNDKTITGEQITIITTAFLEQQATNNIRDFIESKGGFHGKYAHGEDGKIPERNESDSMTNKEKDVQEGISLPSEKKDAKELLKEQLQEGVRNVLNSENYKNWLDTSSKLFLNNYSFNNAILVWCQKPNATYTMGYEQWKEYGRNVRQKKDKDEQLGIKIFVPVIAYEKKDGDLWRMIKNNLQTQMKKDPSLPLATYRVGMSKLEITMNQNGLYGLRLNGKEQGIRSEKDMQNLIKHSIVGKVPMYFTVGNVFDVQDTITPEYLWLKKGFTKDEMVRDENGKAVKNKRGEYKIINTPERQAKFNPSLNMSVPEKDPVKMAILYDALKAVSERNGIPVYEKNRDEDKTLKRADGYFSREFDAKNPKGFIVMPKDLNPTKAVSVMLHEMGHSELHGNLTQLAQKMGEDNIPRNMREIQAEAVAYVVGKNFGIETDTSSFQYIASYTKGFELQALSKSMEVIYNECKQLTSELKSELEVRGLNMDLSDRNNALMDKETIETFSKSYVTFAVGEENRIADIEKELPDIANQNADKSDVVSVVVQQSVNITRQKEDIAVIKEAVAQLQSANTFENQKEQIALMESAKERIAEYKQDFEELSSQFQNLSQERGGLKDKFVADPVNTIEEMKNEYPKLEDLTKAQIQYLSKSEYVLKELSPLLRNHPQEFVDNIYERASQIDHVASKNGMFVEISNCEQWTDKPIFVDGAIMHPKVADTIVKQAEIQIQGLKVQAQKTGEYFPYTKCNLMVYQAEKGEITHAFHTHVDIGDGSQVNLSSHLKEVCKKDSFVNDFEKATREKGAKEKILFNTEKVQEQGSEDQKDTPLSERAISGEDWKEQIQLAREIEEGNKGESEQEVEKQDHKNDIEHC